MGRYDGEDYEERPPCAPGDHNWAVNGTCWKCGCNREALIRQAEALLRSEGRLT